MRGLIQVWNTEENAGTATCSKDWLTSVTHKRMYKDGIYCEEQHFQLESSRPIISKSNQRPIMPQQAVQMCLHHVFGVILMLAAFGSGHAKMTSDDVFVSNTTQLWNNGSREEPQVLAIQRPCGSEHEGYCVNGACTYLSDLDIPVCRCYPMYSGVRCEHMILDSQHVYSPEEVIGICCGVILFLGALIVVILFCYLKRCQKTSPPYKNYGSGNSV